MKDLDLEGIFDEVPPTTEFLNTNRITQLWNELTVGNLYVLLVDDPATTFDRAFSLAAHFALGWIDHAEKEVQRILNSAGDSTIAKLEARKEEAVFSLARFLFEKEVALEVERSRYRSGHDMSQEIERLRALHHDTKLGHHHIQRQLERLRHLEAFAEVFG